MGPAVSVGSLYILKKTPWGSPMPLPDQTVTRRAVGGHGHARAFLDAEVGVVGSNFFVDGRKRHVTVRNRVEFANPNAALVLIEQRCRVGDGRWVRRVRSGAVPGNGEVAVRVHSDGRVHLIAVECRVLRPDVAGTLLRIHHMHQFVGVFVNRGLRRAVSD